MSTLSAGGLRNWTTLALIQVIINCRRYPEWVQGARDELRRRELELDR